MASNSEHLTPTNDTRVERFESIPQAPLDNSIGVQHHPFEDLLSKRDDVCTNAFGDGWLSSICAPGRTLCCVNEKQSYPQCQQHMGLGWCCTEADKGCYLDLQSSACGQPGAVQCSQLGPGVDQACCPQYTTCSKGYNATTTSVRCDIQELALQSLAPLAKSSIGAVIETMGSTDTQESTQSSQSSDKTSSSESARSTFATQSDATSRSATRMTRTADDAQTGTPEPASTYTDNSTPAETASTQPSSESSLTTGTWVGIVVGAVAGVALLCLAVWLIWRKRRRARSRAAASVQQYALEKRPDAGLQDQRKEDLYDVYSRRHEMEDTRRQELWGGAFSPKEMQAREVAELDGSAR